MTETSMIKAWYKFYLRALDHERRIIQALSTSDVPPHFKPVHWELFEARWAELDSDPEEMHYQMQSFEWASRRFGIPLPTLISS